MTSDSNSPRSAIESAKRTIAIERQAVEQLEQRIDDSFSKAVDLLASVDGRVIVSGMGKSGHIGNKIAATLAVPVRQHSLCIQPKLVMAIWGWSPGQTLRY